MTVNPMDQTITRIQLGCVAVKFGMSQSSFKSCQNGLTPSGLRHVTFENSDLKLRNINTVKNQLNTNVPTAKYLLNPESPETINAIGINISGKRTIICLEGGAKPPRGAPQQMIRKWIANQIKINFRFDFDRNIQIAAGKNNTYSGACEIRPNL